jgi:hypothetical protein
MVGTMVGINNCLGFFWTKQLLINVQLKNSSTHNSFKAIPQSNIMVKIMIATNH